MADDENLSCAADIATFSIAAMKNPLFAKVVRTIKYKCDARTELGREKGKIWTNTNVLLRSALAHRYDGVKTGWVPRAHGCDKVQREWGTLVTRVSRNTPDYPPDDVRASSSGGDRGLPLRAGMKLMVVVVGSASQNERFSDTQALVAYAWRCLETAPCAQSALLGSTAGLHAHPNLTSMRGVLRAAKTLSAAAAAAAREGSAGLADSQFKSGRRTALKRPLPSPPCISHSSSSASLSSLLSFASPPAATKPAVAKVIKPRERGGAAGGNRRGANAKRERDVLRPPAPRVASEAVLSARFRSAMGCTAGAGQGDGSARKRGPGALVGPARLGGASRGGKSEGERPPWTHSHRSTTGSRGPSPQSSCAQESRVAGSAAGSARQFAEGDGSGGDCGGGGGGGGVWRSADVDSETGSHGDGDGDDDSDREVGQGWGASGKAAAGPHSSSGTSGRGQASSTTCCALPPVEGATDGALDSCGSSGKGGFMVTPPHSPHSAYSSQSPTSPHYTVIRSPTSFHVPSARIALTSPCLSPVAVCTAKGGGTSLSSIADRAPPFGRHPPTLLREPLACHSN
jgi:hypothetical protein